MLQNPWLPYHEFLSKSYAKIVGAKTEVVAMNTLTVNYTLMMVSFYRPTSKRFKIVMIEGDAFPSDIYAIESQIKFHGFKIQEALIKLKPNKGESTLKTEDIISKLINDQGDDIALIILEE